MSRFVKVRSKEEMDALFNKIEQQQKTIRDEVLTNKIGKDLVKKQKAEEFEPITKQLGEVIKQIDTSLKPVQNIFKRNIGGAQVDLLDVLNDFAAENSVLLQEISDKISESGVNIQKEYMDQSEKTQDEIKNLSSLLGVKIEDIINVLIATSTITNNKISTLANLLIANPAKAAEVVQSFSQATQQVPQSQQRVPQSQQQIPLTLQQIQDQSRKHAYNQQQKQRSDDFFREQERKRLKDEEELIRSTLTKKGVILPSQVMTSTTSTSVTSGTTTTTTTQTTTTTTTSQTIPPSSSRAIRPNIDIISKTPESQESLKQKQQAEKRDINIKTSTDVIEYLDSHGIENIEDIQGLIEQIKNLPAHEQFPKEEEEELIKLAEEARKQRETIKPITEIEHNLIGRRDFLYYMDPKLEYREGPYSKNEQLSPQQFQGRLNNNQLHYIENFRKKINNVVDKIVKDDPSNLAKNNLTALANANNINIPNKILATQDTDTYNKSLRYHIKKELESNEKMRDIYNKNLAAGYIKKYNLISRDAIDKLSNDEKNKYLELSGKYYEGNKTDIILSDLQNKIKKYKLNELNIGNDLLNVNILPPFQQKQLPKDRPLAKYDKREKTQMNALVRTKMNNSGIGSVEKKNISNEERIRRLEQQKRLIEDEIRAAESSSSSGEQERAEKMRDYLDKFKGLGMQQPVMTNKKYDPYKMSAKGEFGKLMINVPLLKRLELQVHKDGEQLCHQECPFDLHELLTKKYDKRKKYDPKAIELFSKLIKHSELPLNMPKNAKFRNIIQPQMYGSSNSLRKNRGLHNSEYGQGHMNGEHMNEEHEHKNKVLIFNDPNEVSDRLHILMAEKEAGNDNEEVMNEISQLIEWLKEHGHLDNDNYIVLMKASGLAE